MFSSKTLHFDSLPKQPVSRVQDRHAVRQRQLASPSFVFSRRGHKLGGLGSLKRLRCLRGQGARKCGLSVIYPAILATRNKLYYHIRQKHSDLARHFIWANVQIPDLEMLAVPSLGQSPLIYTWAAGCRSFPLILQAGLALAYHKHI